MRAARQVEQVGADIARGQDPGLQRLDDIASLLRSASAGVDENLGAAHRLVVAFAHARVIGADQIDVLAGAQPGAFDQRCLRERGAAHDVGPRHGLRPVDGHRHRDLAAEVAWQ